jgi:hypothetical protein
MSKADEYLSNAAECQRMADITRSPAEKALWLQMAESWRRMVSLGQRSAHREQGTPQAASQSQ